MEVAALQKAFEATEQSVKALIAQRDDEIKKRGAADEATAKKLDEQGKLLNETKAALEAKLEETFNKVRDELKDAGVRMDEIDKKLGRGKASGMTAQEALEGGSKAIARTFIESPAFQARKSGATRTTVPVLVKSFFPGASEQAVKALMSDVISGFIQPERIAPLPMVRRQLRVRDLLPVRSTDKPSIEYVEMTGMAPAAGAVALSSLTQSAGTATATTSSAHGLRDGMIVRIAGANQAGYNGDHYITVASSTTFTFTVDSGTVSPATGTVTWLNLSNQAGGAAAVAEGGTKPETLISYVLRTAAAKKIAHWIPASDEVLADEGQLQAQIEDQLLLGVAFAEEQALLYGSGTGANLQGLMTHSRVQTYAWSAGETLPVPDTKIDAFRRAITLAQVREYVPSGGVLNPVDFEDFELAKGSDGHYIWLNVQTGVGLRAFQLPLVITNAILAGDGLVGAFSSGAQIWDREEATVQIADQHDDYWIKNMLAIRAEERLMFPIFRPDSFVAIDFDAEPS